jgi:hypothetical protein
MATERPDTASRPRGGFLSATQAATVANAIPPPNTGSELDLEPVATTSSRPRRTHARPSRMPLARSTSSDATAATSGIEKVRVGL